jgi:ABC-type nitrate/sulfonate/bicarbonate transport system permease component
VVNGSVAGVLVGVDTGVAMFFSFYLSKLAKPSCQLRRSFDDGSIPDGVTT